VELDGHAIAWDSVTAAAFPYRLWQQSGPRNPLGRLRFGFANRFGIALHDTPSPELFEVMSRAFSHGCVRVADAEGFAGLLLRDLPGWSAESLRAALADTFERHLALPDPIPVYVDYWTAWVDADGTMEFRPDVYGWDAKLAAALRRRAHRP
jgi:murein L,D-transpeptidase YcbB/YkuD